jgi:hypothetical protein
MIARILCSASMVLVVPVAGCGGGEMEAKEIVVTPKPGVVDLTYSPRRISRT